MSDRTAIETVKARLNIADVVRRYVDLRPVSGRWMGACPFHQETKPSMSVHEDEGFFYCFGCQASGDVIEFYRRINGLEFRDALEQLADEAGVELKNVQRDPKAEEDRRKKKLFETLHEQARDWFAGNLRTPAGRIAVEYMKRRGLAPEIVRDFGLGYSPDDWHGLDHHLQSLGGRPEDAATCGLLSKNEKGRMYDRFRGRLIFPIQNLSGKVIAFGGRILTDGEPKYLNSSDSPIYKKGEHLYGLYQARTAMNRTKRALLTEGYMDVLSLHQFGFQESCGVLGTALTPEQVKRLGGFCSRVDLVFDGDGAGRKAALRSAEMILLQGVACNVVLLPEGEDVDSLLQTKGREGFEACLKEATPGLEYSCRVLREEHAPKDAMNWAKNFMSRLGDSSLRAYYLPRLVKGLGLSEAELLRSRDFVAAATAPAPAPRRETDAPARGANERRHRPAAQALGNLGKEEKDDQYFLQFAIQHPEHLDRLEAEGVERALATEWGRGLWRKIRTCDRREIISRLDESEQPFWAEKRAEGDQRLQSPEEVAEELEYICLKLSQCHLEETKQQLLDSYKRAVKSGDSELAREYLQAYNEALKECRRRDDEQH